MRGQKNYNAHLQHVSRKWRNLGDAEKQQYHDAANLQPIPVDLPEPTLEDDHAVHPSSPWGLGSAVYPCAAGTLKAVVDEMLPHGQQWVRQMYQQCRDATEPDALANCVVKNTQPPLNLDRLRRQKAAAATCSRAHPGLCIRDPNATSIRSFHASLKKAMQTFKLDPATASGDALFLFAGYRRKTDADQAQRRVRRDAVDSVSADDFEMAFMTAEPERRKQLKVYARCHCRVDDQSRFHFGSHAGLVQTDDATLDEKIGHGFSNCYGTVANTGSASCSPTRMWMRSSMSSKYFFVFCFVFVQQRQSGHGCVLSACPCNLCIGPGHQGHGCVLRQNHPVR